jgi:hypothetical protein
MKGCSRLSIARPCQQQRLGRYETDGKALEVFWDEVCLRPGSHVRGEGHSYWRATDSRLAWCYPTLNQAATMLPRIAQLQAHQDGASSRGSFHLLLALAQRGSGNSREATTQRRAAGGRLVFQGSLLEGRQPSLVAKCGYIRYETITVG